MNNPYAEILQEIHDGFWDRDYMVEMYPATVFPYEYDDVTFRACIKIFMSALLWKLWEEQKRLGLSQDKREVEAKNVGDELHEFIRRWTKINTKELYNG